ncbi:alpha/beta hydrolase [Paenibacillus ginsengarvi]|uniref:Alpha/beta hydrolase n=1 Tax=Paenibacillus ginsengarvi TaxID=400777 RepID=A0A3B0BG00_9BACL|nr:alpha/beta hydrolase [Paenibacillus ginsengarvi]RKN71238.1 alpha/beta hydrolase [Paenibacillus ginsengarvi]
MSIELWPEGAPYQAGNTEEDRPRIDAYPVKSDKPVGCVIICPGGGYARRADHEKEPVAKWLNSIGVAAFVLHYRVAPYRHPAPLEDCRRAIRWVRSHAEEYGIDPDKIGILGFSAGGHAAAMAGIHHEPGNPEAADPIDRVSSRPNALVLCYAVISFVEQYHEGSMINLLGQNPSQEMRELLSGELSANAETPPTFMWHTGNDAPVPVANSLMLAATLSKHKVPYDLHVYENGRHGLGLAESHPEAYMWTQECANWLRRQGFAAETEGEDAQGAQGA